MSTMLITGAGTGIGRASALQLAQLGHVVFAAGRRRGPLDSLTTEARPLPGQIIPLELDVRDADSIRATVEKIKETVPGGVDVLVNNAGYSVTGPIETLSADIIRGQYDTNVLGLIEMTKAVLPGMRAKKSGRIVNVSSVLGKMSFVGSGIYGSSKFAVEAISDALRMELAGFGIDVVIIEPGFARTDIDISPAGDIEIADYTTMVGKFRTYLAKADADGATPESIAKAVVQGVASRRPRPRYVAPARWSAVMGLLNSLPTRAADKAKLSQVF